MSAEALTLERLSVARAGRLVVREVSFAVPRGEITALLGPNGAGKSSLALAIAGVLRPTSGAIRTGGMELTARRPEQVRRAGLATVPEGHRVLGQLSVADNLKVAAARLPRRARGGALDRVHALFGELRELGDRLAGGLSGGQQQMLALAQAIIGDPQFLIIDELSLGLAPVVVRRLVPALREIAAQGVGVLLIEQFTSLALSVATTAHVLVRGRLQLSEAADVLRQQPDLLATSYHLSGTVPAAVQWEP
jgi:branched-chain amino acid transport system ATP-binding protein